MDILDKQIHYVLIDFENVKVKSLALLKGKNFRVRVFLGPKNSRLPTELVLAMKSLGDRADYIVLDAGGHNALDFHITYYLGRLAAMDPAGYFHIISKDTGFDSLVEHLKAGGVKCERSVSIDEIAPSSPKTTSVDEVSNTKINATPKMTSPEAKTLTKHKADTLVDMVLKNLVKRKGGRPGSQKALCSTIKAVCGSQYSEKEIEAVFNRLVKKKYVVVDGARVSYAVPTADSEPVT